MEDPIERDLPNLASPISVAQKSFLIYLIAQTLNTGHLAGEKLLAQEEKEKKNKKKEKKNSIQVGLNKHNQKKGGW